MPQAHWLRRSNSGLATLNPPLRRTKITTFRIFYRHFFRIFITTILFYNNMDAFKSYSNQRIYINQFLIISWNKLLDNIISRIYMLILLRIMHEFNQDWLNLYQTEIGSFHPLCLTHTHTHTHAGRGEELLLLSKKTFSFRFSTFDEREVSTLDAESRKDTFDQI